MRSDTIYDLAKTSRDGTRHAASRSLARREGNTYTDTHLSLRMLVALRTLMHRQR